MNVQEPLWDHHGRTLALGTNVAEVVDGLLRFQNARDHQRPITLYVIGSATAPALTPTDALLVCSAIRSLRSRVITVGMGLMQLSQTLVIATGTDRRYLLKYTVLSLTPPQWQSQHRPLGLHPAPLSPDSIFETQLAELLTELKLEPTLFDADKLITADEAVALGLADEVVLACKTPARQRKNPNRDREP